MSRKPGLEVATKRMGGKRAKAGPGAARRGKGRGDGPKPNKRNRLAEIMDAALDLFAERDYAAVTVNEIARIVGVRHSLIYYYFRSKDELFHKTIEGQIHKTLESYQSIAVRYDHPVDLIEHWLDTNIELSGRIRKLVKIMFDYSGPRARPRSLDKAIKSFYDAELNIIGSSIQKGTEMGMFRSVDARRVAAFVSTHIDGIFFSSLMRHDIDMAGDMAELKRVLWLILGYEAGAGKRADRRRKSGR